jgi:Nucleoside-diphosphate-sugar epimerases
MNNGMDTVVIFGGTGFIGTHVAQHWLREKLARQIILVDVSPPRNEPYTSELQSALKDGRASYVCGDVRNAEWRSQLPESAGLIFNLAAIHREPGHMPREYFETNLRGAENVCAYASAAQCRQLVFTSSISPYGPSEDVKNEDSIPVPETPYGSSKLAAEKIHLGWQTACPNRKLLILRPGVVFGPGEGGNVTRLVRSLVKGYFVYMGNRRTRKAGGYVKELCHVIQFGLQRQDSSEESSSLLNFSMNPPPALEDFVSAIRKIAGIRRQPLSVPRSLLLSVSYPIDGIAKTFGIRQPISPVRVRKLFRSTYIEPKRLRDLNYSWKYTLEEAFADWKHDLPQDFAK